MPVVNHSRNSTVASYQGSHGLNRARIIYGLLLIIASIFIVRLFYLQVIRYDYYANAALNTQLKEYQIPAERGVIYAQNGSDKTPLVLNEILYTLFADPTFVDNPEEASLKLAEIVDGDANEINELLKTPDTRYVIISKRLNKEQHQKVNELDIAGIGTREESYRTYPQGALASQTLGFVNADNEGQYGIEQFLDEKLGGEPGELKAITDSNGVPLVSNPDNVVTEPKNGQSIALTIDLGIQRQVESLLKSGLKDVKSESGSIVVIDPNNGDVKAMANYPTYDPNKLNEVKDVSSLANAAINSPLEVGSIMKSLTAAAALNEKVVGTNSSYYNPGFVKVGDREITDVGSYTGTQTTESLLVHSLNTGAVWLLKQLGGGDINSQARTKWHSYMTRNFYLGTLTGIEQAGEAAGYIPEPEVNGEGIDVTYANTSFGQAMSATPLQMAAAFSGIVNGGMYYQPTLIDSVRDDQGNWQRTEPIVKRSDVVSSETSATMRSLLKKVLSDNWYGFSREGYSIGGKTGTAEIARSAEEGGGYYEDRYNGTYVGFVGGDMPEYVILVRVNTPKVPGFAGSSAAAPIFKSITNMLIDNFGVTPNS